MIKTAKKTPINIWTWKRGEDSINKINQPPAALTSQPSVHCIAISDEQFIFQRVVAHSIAKIESKWQKSIGTTAGSTLKRSTAVFRSHHDTYWSPIVTAIHMFLNTYYTQPVGKHGPSATQCDLKCAIGMMGHNYRKTATKECRGAAKRRR